MPYNAGATKAMKAIKKEYGDDWQHVFYGLANKRSGKRLKGKHRGHLAANKAYAKGSKWGKKGKSRSVTVKTKGKANVAHRSKGTHIKIQVG